MLTKVDHETALRWRKLGARIGRRACHGSAHVESEKAWEVSAYDDMKEICTALRVVAPGEIHDPDGSYVREWWPSLGRALDWGAGAGRLTPWLLVAADEVVNVDASPELLALGPQHERLRSIVCSDPTTCHIDDDGLGFDLIVCIHVVYSMTPDGMMSTVESLARMLKPGGALVIDIPHVNRDRGIHHDPDPLGLPGGWWAHSGGLVLLSAMADVGLVVERQPVALGPAPSWVDLAPLALWTLRRPS